MTGGAKHNEAGQDRPTTHRCVISSCRRSAIASCFECERLCCERHLTAIALATAKRPFRARVCPACLRRYRTDPEIQRLLTYDALQLPAQR